MYLAINRSVSAIVLVSWLSACTGWEVQRVAPERVLQDSQFVRRGVRVTTVSGQRVQIAHPALRADTLTSTSDTVISIPLEQVRELEVRRPSAARTGALIGGSAIGAALATVGVMCMMFCGSID